MVAKRNEVAIDILFKLKDKALYQAQRGIDQLQRKVARIAPSLDQIPVGRELIPSTRATQGIGLVQEKIDKLAPSLRNVFDISDPRMMRMSTAWDANAMSIGKVETASDRYLKGFTGNIDNVVGQTTKMRDVYSKIVPVGKDFLGGFGEPRKFGEIDITRQIFGGRDPVTGLRNLDRFRTGIIQQGQAFKPLRESGLDAGFALGKLNVLQDRYTGYAKQAGVPTYELGRVMRRAGQSFDDYGNIINGVSGKQEKWGAGANKVRGASKRFRMELLSVMFAGMALSRMFSGLLKPSLEAVGIFNIWTNTLKIMFIPISLVLLKVTLALMKVIMGLTEEEKKAIGMVVLLGTVFGFFLMFIGQVGLGLGGLSMLFLSLGVSMWKALAIVGLLISVLAILGGGMDGVKAIGNLVTGSFKMLGIGAKWAVKGLDMMTGAMAEAKPIMGKMDKALNEINKTSEGSATRFDTMNTSIVEAETAFEEFGTNATSVTGIIQTNFSGIETAGGDLENGLKINFGNVDTAIDETGNKTESLTNLLNKESPKWDVDITEGLINPFETVNTTTDIAGNAIGAFDTSWGEVDWTEMGNDLTTLADFAGDLNAMLSNVAAGVNKIIDVWEGLENIPLKFAKWRGKSYSEIAEMYGMREEEVREAIGNVIDIKVVIPTPKPQPKPPGEGWWQQPGGGWQREIPSMALGGIVTRPTTALIGEGGPEAIIPLGRGIGVGKTINVYFSPTINMTNEIREEVDMETVKRTISEDLVREVNAALRR